VRPIVLATWEARRSNEKKDPGGGKTQKEKHKRPLGKKGNCKTKKKKKELVSFGGTQPRGRKGWGKGVPTKDRKKNCGEGLLCRVKLEKKKRGVLTTAVWGGENKCKGLNKKPTRGHWSKRQKSQKRSPPRCGTTTKKRGVTLLKATNGPWGKKKKNPKLGEKKGHRGGRGGGGGDYLIFQVILLPGVGVGRKKAHRERTRQKKRVREGLLGGGGGHAEPQQGWQKKKKPGGVQKKV